MLEYFAKGVREARVSIDPSQVRFKLPKAKKIANWPALLDEEFAIFECFKDPEETVLDLGANTGLAAASIFKAGCRATVLSFEPNPQHHPVLSDLKSIFKERFDFAPLGLGTSRGSISFFTPVVDGRAIDQLSTANPMFGLPWALPENILIYCMNDLANVEEPHLQFCETQWPIEPLDEVLAEQRFLVPTEKIAAIKLDLEGFEEDALTGAQETLSNHKPLIMIESGNREKSVDGLLRKQGYLYADFHEGSLVLTDMITTRVNGFYLHSEKLGLYADMGILRR
ncbi:MAG: FkbM family methyltransferase [Pseudomonadota bacterium]